MLQKHYQVSTDTQRLNNIFMSVLRFKHIFIVLIYNWDWTQVLKLRSPGLM